MKSEIAKILKWEDKNFKTGNMTKRYLSIGMNVIRNTFTGTGAVVYSIFHVLVVPCPVQVFTNGQWPRKTADHHPSIWDSATHLRSPDETPGSKIIHLSQQVYLELCCILMSNSFLWKTLAIFEQLAGCPGPCRRNMGMHLKYFTSD